MLDAGELRKGTAIELNGGIYVVVEYQHVKMQQRQPVVKLKLRDVRSGNVTERNFQSGDKLHRYFWSTVPSSTFITMVTFTISWIMRVTSKSC
jgi:elongation factor P